MSRRESIERLVDWYRAGVAAAEPRHSTADATRALDDLADTVWVLAIGKGSSAMATGAASALREIGVRQAGGLVVSYSANDTADHGLAVAIGDHPVPGQGSLAASRRLGEVIGQVPATDDALVLVSGGATSLVAGPADGVDPADLPRTFEALLASGADIELMNALRKRVLRWGAGRLAVALRARRVHCLIASDVPGNDPAFIASGPCVPDALTAADVLRRAGDADLLSRIPDAVVRLLESQAAGTSAETPKPDHPRFRTTTTRIILDRHVAVRGVVEAARRDGAECTVDDAALTGDAGDAGRRVTRLAIEAAGTVRSGRPHLLAWSGETTVRLDADAGHGGRCQEMALTAAHALQEAGDVGRRLTILAAGTDGRDGPTDAAGAVVDASTWEQVASNGVDPAASLARHDSFTALEAAGALVRTGPTGTNVNDLVLALVDP